MLVPAGSTSLTFCQPKVRTVTSGFQDLVRALDRLPTRTSTGNCSPLPGSAPAPGTRSLYQFFLSYPQGPPVLVSIIGGCYPEVMTAGLQAHSASSVMPIIQQLLKGT